MILKQMWHLAKQASTLGRPPKRWFSSGPEDNNYGIKFDEQEIRRKMAEIKQRKSNPNKGKTEKLEFMGTDSNSQIARAVRKYRQATNTENLFHFNDPTLEEKPTIMQITGFDETSIEIDNMVYPPSLIIFPKQVLVWQVASVQDLSIDHFIILKYIHPKPTYVIIGLPNPALLPASIADYLRSNFDNFDCLELFQASSQFNTMANDDIDTVGFFITK